ncbi:MAG: hypothetical protein ACPGR7_08205 [Flavobacteriaceae bacterium]
MKKYSLILFMLIGLVGYSQEPKIQGSFERSISIDDDHDVVELWKFVDHYFVVTAYNPINKVFYYTYGGAFYTDQGKFKSNVSFSHEAPMAFAAKISHHYKLEPNKLSLMGLAEGLERIDQSMNGELSQTWIITGRKVNGEMTTRQIGARKTLKILTDRQFQWIAFNEESGDFRGTGGGNYSAKNGVYTEHIKFFSRDSSRVGQSLKFQYAKDGENWIHSGMSSKGKPIYEIWSPLSLAEKSMKK